MMESIGKLWKVIKAFFSSTFGKAFDDIMEFFGGLVKHGDDMAKTEKNVVTHADDVKKPNGLKEGTNHADDGKKGLKEEPKKKPYGDDAMRNAAYAAVAEEVVQSNLAHEPMSKFKLDIKSLRAKFPIIRSLDLVPSIDGGYDVWMTASPKKWVGHKKRPKSSFEKQMSNSRADKTAKSFDEGGGHTYERHSSSKSDKWLIDRANRNIAQPVGDAATKFKNPNIHVKVVNKLEAKAIDAIKNGPPYPAGMTGPANPQIGNVYSLKKIDMGENVGYGFILRVVHLTMEQLHFPIQVL